MAPSGRRRVWRAKPLTQGTPVKARQAQLNAVGKRNDTIAVANRVHLPDMGQGDDVAPPTGVWQI